MTKSTQIDDFVCLHSPKEPVRKVLVLGYDEHQCSIIKALKDSHCYVGHTAAPISGEPGFDFVVSFGYRHILSQRTIDKLACPVFNLHISYLPFNRGAHPNFWSFFDKTPSGVTIHLVDEGIDTGPIVFQKRILFDRSELTFSKTQARLIKEIEGLFIDNLPALLNGKWTAREQVGKGTYHRAEDLPLSPTDWDVDIESAMLNLSIKGDWNGKL